MTITIDNLIGMTKHTLTLYVPIPQNGQTHKNNSPQSVVNIFAVK